MDCESCWAKRSRGMVVDNRLSFFRVAIIAALVWVASVSVLVAQDDTKSSDLKTELGLRQRLVERKMSELETKLTVIAEKLREKEPERAKLLVAAYQQSKERLITKKMAQINPGRQSCSSQRRRRKMDLPTRRRQRSLQWELPYGNSFTQ